MEKRKLNKEEVENAKKLQKSQIVTTDINFKKRKKVYLVC